MQARIALIGSLGLAYLVGTHWLMTSASPSPWNAVALLTPMLAAIAVPAWRARQRARCVLALAAIGLLCAQAALGVQVPAPLLYLGQHVAVHLMLALWFASTLRAGSQALITGLAARVHTRMPPSMVAYTRNVTRAWVVYFIAMALASLALYAFASFDAWALFANLGTPLSLVAMFGGEWLLRYRLHPEFERSSVADAIRAYRQAAAGPRTPPREVPEVRDLPEVREAHEPSA